MQAQTVLGLLPKGCCAIFDSRTLHCGGANRSDKSRALFYFTFKNPKIGDPGNPPRCLDFASLLTRDVTPPLLLHPARAHQP
jgi:hypothetical protein